MQITGKSFVEIKARFVSSFFSSRSQAARESLGSFAPLVIFDFISNRSKA
ncbi:hypothetical protein Hanom_Chr04g00346731 [Helianthus anomalus]